MTTFNLQDLIDANKDILKVIETIENKPTKKQKQTAEVMMVDAVAKIKEQLNNFENDKTVS